MIIISLTFQITNVSEFVLRIKLNLYCAMAQAVSHGFSPWRSWFEPGTVHVTFVVDKVALGQGFLRVRPFSSVSIIPPWHPILMYHMGDEQ
jgi:hypothetical protein